MTDKEQIHVRLVEEPIDVWRPVEAEHVHDDVYRIVEQSYDRSIETWEFEPGDLVVAEPTASSDATILAATRLETI